MLLVNRLSLYLRREWLTLVLAAACSLLAVDFVTGPLGVRDLMVLRERRASSKECTGNCASPTRR